MSALIKCIFLLCLCRSIVSDSDETFTSVVLRKNQKTPPTFLYYAGKQYFFQTVFRGNFFRSQQFCNRHGMRLVSITSQAENDRLGRFAQEIGYSHSHFWTSGTDLPLEGEWIWLTTGNAMTYTNWYPGEPNKGSKNVSENCVEARTFDKYGFSWNNAPCSYIFYAICESLTDSNCTKF